MPKHFQGDFLAPTDAKRRKQLRFGICGDCYQPKTGDAWCQPCNARRLAASFSNWSSGNREIDKFIQHTQLTALNQNDIIQWIDFHRLDGIQILGCGGYGTVYKAIWTLNRSSDLLTIQNRSQRNSFRIEVALKPLFNVTDKDEELIHETSLIIESIKVHARAFQCLGVTRNPANSSYIMVIQYVPNLTPENLSNYIYRGFGNWNWKNIIANLLYIASDLKFLHHNGLVHGGLNSGELLVHGTPLIHIDDEHQNAQSYLDQINMKGKKYLKEMVPYIAPEVLEGFEYTQAADIYSFGILMWESTSNGKRPFCKVPYDDQLVISICDGLRPDVHKETPPLFVELMKRCWDGDYLNRPKAAEIFQILLFWDEDLRLHNRAAAIFRQVEEAEDNHQTEFFNKISKRRKISGKKLSCSHIELNSVTSIPSTGNDNDHNVIDSEAKKESLPANQREFLEDSSATIKIRIETQVDTIYHDENLIGQTCSNCANQIKASTKSEKNIDLDQNCFIEEDTITQDRASDPKIFSNDFPGSDQSFSSQNSEKIQECKGKNSIEKDFSSESLKGVVVGNIPSHPIGLEKVSSQSTAKFYNFKKPIPNTSITKVDSEKIEANLISIEQNEEKTFSKIAYEPRIDKNRVIIDENLDNAKKESHNGNLSPNNPPNSTGPLNQRNLEPSPTRNVKKQKLRFKVIGQVISLSILKAYQQNEITLPNLDEGLGYNPEHNKDDAVFFSIEESLDLNDFSLSVDDASENAWNKNKLDKNFLESSSLYLEHEVSSDLTGSSNKDSSETFFYKATEKQSNENEDPKAARDLLFDNIFGNRRSVESQYLLDTFKQYAIYAKSAYCVTQSVGGVFFKMIKDQTNKIIVAFRGDEKMLPQFLKKDHQIQWPANEQEKDFHKSIYSDVNNAFVHELTYKAFLISQKEILIKLKQLVGKDLAPDFHFSGHSIGAAYALLAALATMRTFKYAKIRVFTFGQYRTGNRAFADYINTLIGRKKLMVYRITQRFDRIVQWQAWIINRKYKHHALEYFIVSSNITKVCYNEEKMKENWTCSLNSNPDYSIKHPEYANIHNGPYFGIIELRPYILGFPLYDIADYIEPPKSSQMIISFANTRKFHARNGNVIVLIYHYFGKNDKAPGALMNTEGWNISFGMKS
ncbi:hypothetical protein G9A89_023408 [Geosiphon pyriformis]|nr:hypothetical protein G9A89_023408 [Geosiphon pyriformis]